MNKRRSLTIAVIAIATLLFLASSCTTSANNAPTIAGLEPEAQEVVPLSSVQVVCTASDLDGDELSYAWSASAGQINGVGDTVGWIAPASEGSYSVAVVVTDGHGGQATDSVTIAVRTNSPPTIASLTVDTGWTAPAGSIQVTCSASDPDGDELTYDWSASSGDISGTGSTVTWTAPQEVGTYEVTVVVADAYGDSATKSIPVSALTGQPPVIESLLITAEHCYLKPISGAYYVGKGQIYAIECIVADSNIELSYEWSYTDGELAGEGHLITWTAPEVVGEITVAVTVSDISGRSASEELTLLVASCSPCIFGC